MKRFKSNIIWNWCLFVLFVLLLLFFCFCFFVWIFWCLFFFSFSFLCVVLFSVFVLIFVCLLLLFVGFWVFFCCLLLFFGVFFGCVCVCVVYRYQTVCNVTSFVRFRYASLLINIINMYELQFSVVILIQRKPCAPRLNGVLVIQYIILSNGATIGAIPRVCPTLHHADLTPVGAASKTLNHSSLLGNMSSKCERGGSGVSE